MTDLRFSSWLSLSYKTCIHTFLTEISELYNRPTHVTYHAFEILDKVIAACDEHADLKKCLKLTSLICFIMACKMNGKYPPYDDVTFRFNVTLKKLEAHELWVLTILGWNISSCYSFMDIHIRLPEHMLPFYHELLSKSYETNQLNKYSADVVKETLLYLLSGGDTSFLSDIRKDVNLNARHLCELDLQRCKDMTPYSALSHSPVHIFSEEENEFEADHWKLVKSGSAYTAPVGSSYASAYIKCDDDPEY